MPVCHGCADFLFPPGNPAFQGTGGFRFCLLQQEISELIIHLFEMVRGLETSGGQVYPN